MTRSPRKPSAPVDTLAPASPAPPLPPAPLGSRALLVALAALAGVCMPLAGPDFDLWPLGWLLLAPLCYAIERAPSLRHAVLLGWLAGAVANAGGFYWIIGLLQRFAFLPLPVATLLFLLLAAYQGVVYLLFAWAVRRLRAEHGLPMALVAPLALVTFELTVPFLFPWYLAITQAWQPRAIQLAELAGPLGVSALLALASGALADLALDGRRRLRSSLVAAALVLAALVYGHLRVEQVDRAIAAAPKIDVGVVQPNIAFDLKGLKRHDLADEQVAALQARSRELEAAGADLIVWTESSFPFALPRGLRRDPGVIKDGFDTPLILGAVTREPKDPDAYPFNTALLIDRAGNVAETYDKMFLLMFGEYIPFLDALPWLRKVLPRAAGHFARGDRIVTFPLTLDDGTHVRLGPLICYEDILPAFGRKLAPLHPHLLVNLTNDAWFGDTSEPWQHLALSVFRAVELRTGLVRAVNTGVSALIDATGRVTAKTYAVDPARDPRGADKLLAPAALLEGGHTVYAAIGDLFGYACSLATLLLIAVPMWRRRQRQRRTR